MQCAASKRADAGHLKTLTGTPVSFVAQPVDAPTVANLVYARPDDPSDTGLSWRQVLLAYNERPDTNPLGLLPAYKLYENKKNTYCSLVDRFGVRNVYILSAGWGLIRADFLTPYYDITYSQKAHYYKRRPKSDLYKDLCMLPAQLGDEIVFIGGKDYHPLFVSLTSSIQASKTVYYNSSQQPRVHGYRFERFQTNTRTNWQYECAAALINETLKPPS